jgi:L,D-peptidoglycan transpeptidase YkuD (ErfK/YbiS/YcfS/YnhG family)
MMVLSGAGITIVVSLSLVMLHSGRLCGGLVEAAEVNYVPAQPDMPLADIIATREWERIPSVNLLIDKSDMTLSIRSNDEALKTYPVALGSRSLERKQRRGDRLTPEGEYYICERRRVPNSRAWNAVWMRLSYPNAEDAARGVAAGIISERQARRIKEVIARRGKPPQNTRLGSGIGIHPGGIVPRTWTTGCIALQYPHAVEIYEHTAIRTTVTVRR